MKNLLTVVGDGSDNAVLETAFLVASRFNSHITGINSAASEYADNFAFEPVFSIHSDFNRTDQRNLLRQQEAQSSFRDFMRAHGVPVGAAGQEHNHPTASWFEQDARRNLPIGVAGRVYDLIVIGQPQTLASLAGATFENALFESGRPVLMVPNGNPPNVGDTIGVAWNGSTETAQTVALAMPFLKQAKRVVVIAVGSQHMPEPGPEGEELARMLIREGMTVSLRSAVGRQKGQGESFLHEAEVAGVDFLLKGAYTRSRLRQAIFGGATRHIILESTIPVLMAR
jgi:nucleotide-binding universal stress UspA family protein